MPKKIDVVGARFGRLVVLGETAERVKGRRQVSCRCDCGTLLTCDPRSLRSGRTRSCRCLQRETVAIATPARFTTHGDSDSREYNIWHKMRSRCERKTDHKYHDYGGRGISVCNRWHLSFEAFLADMGRSPSDSHSIERIDVNGNYEPGNCRWATPKEQSRNKRNHRMVSWRGQEVPLSQACEEAGVNYRSALYRLNHGKDWSIPAPPAMKEEAK